MAMNAGSLHAQAAMRTGSVGSSARSSLQRSRPALNSRLPADRAVSLVPAVLSSLGIRDVLLRHPVPAVPLLTGKTTVSRVVRFVPEIVLECVLVMGDPDARTCVQAMVGLQLPAVRMSVPGVAGVLAPGRFPLLHIGIRFPTGVRPDSGTAAGIISAIG